MSKFCPECGKENLDSTNFCEKCGAAIPNLNNGNKKGGLPVWAIILIVVGAIFFLLIGCVAIFSSDSTNNSNEGNGSEITSSPTSYGNERTTTERTTTSKIYKDSDLMLVNIVALMGEKLAFDTGDYQKGDVPAGEYAFVKFKGAGSYYEEEDPAGNILDNENFDSFGYVKIHGKGDITTRGVLINITAFDRLGVSSAKEIYEKLNDTSNYFDAGYYKVGVDIPAGTYTVESYGSGYYAILSGPVGSSDIVKNDNFNGKKTVTVRKGQYLEIHRSSIIMN